MKNAAYRLLIIFISLPWALFAFDVATNADIDITDASKIYDLFLFENFVATEKLFEGEISFLASLSDLSRALKSRRKMTNFLIGETSKRKNADHIQFVKHPINAFNLLRGLYVNVQDQFRDDDGLNTVMDEIRNVTSEFPTDEDFEGAIRGLILLYDTYNFDVVKAVQQRGRFEIIAEGGKTMTFEAGVTNFGLEDVASMAETAFNQTWYDNAIDLLSAYFRLLGNRKSSLRMEKLRKNAVYMNNENLLRYKVMAGSRAKVHPFIYGDDLKVKKKQPKALSDNKPELVDSTFEGRQSYFRKACNGFSARRFFGFREPNFRCGFLHHNDAYLRLGPFKVERAALEPNVIVLHDIMTEAEMNFLVRVSRPNLSRRRRKDDASNFGQHHEFKSGKRRRFIHKTVQYWIEDIGYEGEYADEARNVTYLRPELAKLTRRFELATKMRLSTKWGSSQYQVTNYGLGGLCETHIDPLGFHEGVELGTYEKYAHNGDMLATIMGWIEAEPSAGGATAFTRPNHEVVVRPVKGSAAFWFGIDSKGHRDSLSYHGGCPVAFGSKWIVNKWVYYYDQMQAFPCALHPEAKPEPFKDVY